MPKRLINQRRGSGRPRYKSPSHRFKGEIKYPKIDYKNGINGQLVEFITDAARSAPIAKVLLEDFTTIQIIAPEGMKVGDWISIGGKATSETGNILPLSQITEGSQIFNIESTPGHGGNLVRASGGTAFVVGHDKNTNKTQVKLPSKKMAMINSDCLATIGRAAGGGRTDKPIVLAGKAFHAHKAKGKLYPRVAGRAMNAVDHPHGGGRHPHVGKPTTRSKNTPPGKRVGHVGAKRTGKRKR